jgi:hypothetical protein
VRGGTQVHQLPLELFIGDAVVADLRDKLPAKAITADDLQTRVGASVRRGDRLMLRTDLNNTYDGGSETWMKDSPYLTIGATMWCIDKGVVIVGYDFYHGNDEPDAPRVFHNSRTRAVRKITMPYLKNPTASVEALHADRAAAQTDRRPSLADPAVALAGHSVMAAEGPSRGPSTPCLPRSRVRIPNAMTRKSSPHGKKQVEGGPSMTRRHFTAALLLLASLALPPPARAQDPFPTRPITLVVPLTPGTAIDILARLYADRLAPILGQQVVVLNKPGAGGIVGAEYVASQNADGYARFAIWPFDLEPVNRTWRSILRKFAGITMCAAPATPSCRRASASPIQAFVALAKAPGQLNYGSAGVGTSTLSPALLRGASTSCIFPTR